MKKMRMNQLKRPNLQGVFDCVKKEAVPLGVQFNDYSGDVSARMRQNVQRSLTAMGLKAVELIVGQMQSGYGKPIHDTGDLMRDVNYEVGRSGENTVDVGNSLNYALYVHDGTRRMTARPYITDAIAGGKKELQDTAKEYLSDGFGD